MIVDEDIQSAPQSASFPHNVTVSFMVVWCTLCLCCACVCVCRVLLEIPRGGGCFPIIWGPFPPMFLQDVSLYEQVRLQATVAITKGYGASRLPNQ